MCSIDLGYQTCESGSRQSRPAPRSRIRANRILGLEVDLDAGENTDGFHCNVDSDSALAVAQVWGGGGGATYLRQGGRGRLGFGCLDGARLGPNSRCTKELQGLLQAQDRQHHYSPFAPSPPRRVWDEAADLGRLCFFGFGFGFAGRSTRQAQFLPTGTLTPRQ
jgi:hypothetical protein